MSAKHERQPLLQRCINFVVGWLRLRFHQHKPDGVRSREFNKWGALYRLETQSPGVICQWRIVRRDTYRDLLLTMVGLLQLREDLAAQRSGGSPGSSKHRRRFLLELETDLEQYLEGQALDVSHVFLACWIARSLAGESHETTVAGKHYRRFAGEHRVCTLAVVPCNLQGVAGMLVGDVHALGITAAISKRLFNLHSSLNRWDEDLVSKISWTDWLEGYAKKALGELHVLQPPKTRKRLSARYRTFS